MFSHDSDALKGEGIIRSIYDPACGTGGFLSSGIEQIQEWNPDARIVPYGQELNAQTHAIAVADMMIKDFNAANIKLGNTLSDDLLYAERFDYDLANPPFGVDWKKVQAAIKAEQGKGAMGRFEAGLPRVSDGSLLFLMHLISKMKTDGQSRIGIVLNGSPLFTGGAGSGESEIRRWVLENDWLEAIVALPTDMFYNTGIATGSTRKALGIQQIRKYVLPNPELGLQRAIAAFLDHETARIDTLIAKQEKLIALLKEKRQAVISHAVTQGLDPTVPMKDSGVAWLGEVPEHWVVAPIKYLALLQSGIPKGRDVPPEEAIRVPYLRVANVQDGYLALDDVAEIDIRKSELIGYSLQKGDVLMNEGGDFDKLGRGAVWNSEVNLCIHQNHVFAIRPTNIEPSWLTTVT